MIVSMNTSCLITYVINDYVRITLHDDKTLIVKRYIKNGSNTIHTYIIQNNQNWNQLFGDITYVKNYIKNSIDISRGG
jgi:hypothetical protein